MNTRHNAFRARGAQTGRHGGQRGVTLVIALIALVVLTVGAVAMSRSSDVSLRMAGNLAFKRDLVNQGERAIATALAELNSGGLSAEATRNANRLASNYSATLLGSSEQGIPNVLLSQAAFTAAGFSHADITDTSTGVTVRYVIDRQCTSAGIYDNAACQAITAKPPPKSCDGINCDVTTGAVTRPVYRISVRITGPRGNQTYTQTTVAL
jgi:type IV pilus assembly protein PilX